MPRLLPDHPAYRIALYYGLFGLLWILFSDQIVHSLAGGMAEARWLQTAKGSVFVALSAGLIYGLVRRELESRRRSEGKFRAAFEAGPDPMAITRLRDGLFLDVNRGFTEQLGWDEEELAGKTAADLVWESPGDREGFLDELRDRGEVRDMKVRLRSRNAGTRPYLLSSRVIDPGAEEPRIVSVAKDVSALEMERERAERQLRRLRSLREIDLAITGGGEFRITLEVVLDKVIQELGASAAAILLADPGARTLEFGAGRGFTTDALRHTRLRFGEGHAGQIASQREYRHVPDLWAAPEGLVRSEHLRDEQFVSYVGVPLVAMAEVHGVLEVFHREPLDPSPEWRDFLETLAGQAAIAIDSVRLFRDLQRRNEALADAYDDTIEGWARALDLRDRETYGHTQRVTETTTRLARELGINGEELVHVRRGALLHDIGKLGVPDAILLKPGSLDEEEWQVMRKHPELAYRLLSPIEFLRPALDIPHFHHEKWDGSGYPQGLRREEIPLPARIFAVVDVWDALLSDRPYRDAWPEEKVIGHIESEADSHFDPDVVELFLNLHEEEVLEALREQIRDDGW